MGLWWDRPSTNWRRLSQPSTVCLISSLFDAVSSAGMLANSFIPFHRLSYSFPAEGLQGICFSSWGLQSSVFSQILSKVQWRIWRSEFFPSLSSIVFKVELSIDIPSPTERDLLAPWPFACSWVALENGKGTWTQRESEKKHETQIIRHLRYVTQSYSLRLSLILHIFKYNTYNMYYTAYDNVCIFCDAIIAWCYFHMS